MKMENDGPIFEVGGVCHFDQWQNPVYYLKYVFSLYIVLSEALYEISK
jgi:hypothetical protein